MGVAVLLVSGLSVGTIALWDLNRSVQANTVDISDGTEQTTVGVGALDGGFNVLLAGSDTRQGQGDGYGKTDGALNDVNMVLHVSADHSQASVVSLPRDMVVPIPACARSDGSGTAPAIAAAPLNTALSDGGLPCVAKTVAQFTGLDIPYAALIEFNGVIEMSNAVGGVPSASRARSRTSAPTSTSPRASPRCRASRRCSSSAPATRSATAATWPASATSRSSSRRSCAP